MTDDLSGEIDEIINNSIDDTSSDDVVDKIVDESENVRVELLGYNRHVDVSSDSESNYQELICFSIENTSSESIEIYSDEYTITGDDKFVYDYIEKPWRNISDYPSHYVSEYGYDIPSGSKVRYLVISKDVPSSVGIQKVDYNYSSVSFTLELPDDMPDEVGDPPI